MTVESLGPTSNHTLNGSPFTTTLAAPLSSLVVPSANRETSVPDDPSRLYHTAFPSADQRTDHVDRNRIRDEPTTLVASVNGAPGIAPTASTTLPASFPPMIAI